MTLNVTEIKEKIAMVDRDIERARSEANADMKILALSGYKDFLLDELKGMTNDLGKQN
jgi:hypothetical protein